MLNIGHLKDCHLRDTSKTIMDVYTKSSFYAYI